MSYHKAQAALRAGLLASGVYPAADIAFDGETFSRAGKTRWLRAWFTPAAAAPAELGTDGRDKVEGYFQLDCHRPGDIGAGDVMRDVDAVRAVFWAGRPFTFKGTVVTVRNVSVSPERQSESDLVYTVTVYWYSFVSRK